MNNENSEQQSNSVIKEYVDCVSNRHNNPSLEVIAFSPSLSSQPREAEFTVPSTMPLVEAFFAGYCDRASNGAFGSAVRVDGKIVYTNSGYCGDGPAMSPHVAAYHGALDALTQAVKHEGTISLQGNDQMVIMQLGPDLTFGDKRFKAKHGLYLPYYKKAIALVNRHRDRMLFHCVPWQRNTLCNELAKNAVSNRGGATRSVQQGINKKGGQ